MNLGQVNLLKLRNGMLHRLKYVMLSLSLLPAILLLSNSYRDLCFTDTCRAEHGSRSAVTLITLDKMSSGSGVFVDTKYIITAAHVVDVGDKMLLRNRKGLAYVIWRDDTMDIAVLYYPRGNSDHVTMGNSDELLVGDLVYSVSSPLGVVFLENSFSTGKIMHETSFTTTTSSLPIFIMTDLTITHGSSGGAVYNMHNEIVGLVDFIIVGTGFSFIIPISYVKNDILNAITEHKKVMYAK